MLGDELLLQGDVVVDGDVGEAGFAVGGGVLEGEVDKPFPSMVGTTKKYSSGSRAMLPDQPLVLPVPPGIPGWVGNDVALVLV